MGEQSGAVCLKADKGKGCRMGGGAEEEKRMDVTNGEEGKQLVRINLYHLGSLFHICSDVIEKAQMLGYSRMGVE